MNATIALLPGDGIGREVTAAASSALMAVADQFGHAFDLQTYDVGGAALDVFEIEPLPEDHRLWKAPNFLLTPHMAAAGPHLDERRMRLLVENCRRLRDGEELMNIVDKKNWF